VKRARTFLAAILTCAAALLWAVPGLSAVVVDSAKTGIGYFTNVVIGGNAQIASGGALEVYNTAPISSTNYEKLKLDWSGDVARIWTQNDGTGSPRALQVGASQLDGTSAPQAYTQWRRSSLPTINHVLSNTPTTAIGSFHELASISGLSASSNTQTTVSISPTFAQTGTATGVAFLVNPSGTFGSGGGYLTRWQLAGADRASLDSNGNFEAVTTKTAVTTVATLPTAGITIGTRAMVNDANAPTFGSTVTGGGSALVPVYYDGTNWRVGAANDPQYAQAA
jgi:hypothetical protein